MNWLQLLAFLACPLMMLFCMKGMFGGNKNKKTGAVNTSVSQQESQQLQIKMADLMEQNHKQMKEIEDLKAKQSNNVVQLADERLSKWKIS